MTNQEISNLPLELFNKDSELKIRYFTYSKKDYIDIICRISNDNGLTKLYNRGNYFFTAEYIGTYKYHDNFNTKNIPNLRTFRCDDLMYCHIFSDQIISIVPTSIRAFKIHQIREGYKTKKVSEN
jgi:hypothetical protein